MKALGAVNLPDRSSLVPFTDFCAARSKAASIFVESNFSLMAVPKIPQG